jgi:hypothetical protein
MSVPSITTAEDFPAPERKAVSVIPAPSAAEIFRPNPGTTIVRSLRGVLAVITGIFVGFVVAQIIAAVLWGVC